MRKKGGEMDDGISRWEFVYLLTCGRRSLVSGTQNDSSYLNYPMRDD